jgi:hypothetical protein
LDIDSWETPEFLWKSPRGYETAYERAGVKVAASKKSIDWSFRSLGKWANSLEGQIQVQNYSAGEDYFFIGKIKAYKVLRDPIKRATYDEQLGYAKADIALEIASDKGFGRWWAGLCALWASVVLFVDEVFARMLGNFFAPDFEALWINRVNPNGLTYLSSDPVWQGLLNSWLAMSLAPAAAIGILAYLGYRWIDVPLSRIIAPVRCSGFSDIYVRSFCWVLVLSPHVAFAVLKVWTE